MKNENMAENNNSSFVAKATAIPMAGDRPFRHRPIVLGILAIVVFLAGFSAWLLLAPIESAVIAPGVVSVESHRKTIQHLEGGIVKAILVRDGDRVQRNQTLIQLSDVQPKGALKRLKAQYLEARATQARLIAEREQKETIVFPEELSTLADDPTAISAVTQGQMSVFATRRNLLADRLAVLQQRIAQYEEEIGGLKGQIAAASKRIKLIDEELVAARELYEKELLRKPRLLTLQRSKAEIEGNLSSLRASIARAKQSILELRLQMSELQATRINAASEQLRIVSAQAYELAQQVVAAQDVLQRVQIRSPIDGIIVNLQVHTHGGVIAAGQNLLDVVPDSDALVIQAQIDPVDIDEVRVGLAAHVQLTALNRRNQRPIDGFVKAVSADRLTHEKSGKAYYLARIQLASLSLEALPTPLQAGMGAEVYIRTGARTPFEYLLAPITRALGRGMREK